MNNAKGFKLVLRRLGMETREIPVSDHENHETRAYTLNDCRQFAHRFMGKTSPWKERRTDIWTNGDIVLGIYPYYPESLGHNFREDR